MQEEAARRLAAVVIGDIAGYSELMGRNEEVTHKRVRDIEREVVEPTVAEHRGRIVKTMGDGFLAIFSSPVEAVRCALVIQQSIVVRNTDMPKQDWIRYRIGVNLGDVIIDKDDVFGEGVNIAARLEQLAEPGTVYISGGIYEQIKYKLVAGYQSLGDRKVKHISEPVPIYRVLPDPAALLRATRRQRLRTLAIGAVVLLAVCGTGGWYAWRVQVKSGTAVAEAPTLPSQASLERNDSVMATPDARVGQPAPAPQQEPGAAQTAPEHPVTGAPSTPPNPGVLQTPQPAITQQAAVGPLVHGRSAAPERPVLKEPDMVALSGGTFRMGSNTDASEGPVHQVTVKPFLLGRFPVTVREWRDCVAEHGCDIIAADTVSTSADAAPMSDLSWTDAHRYTEWLSASTGKQYRLPTEAEWEYAARAGTETAYWWGSRMIADVADCKGCGGPYDPKRPLDVGSLKANPFGLYDMAGGVAEWVDDCWHRDYHGAPQNGSTWQTQDCREHVLRGGSWRNESTDVRVSAREFYDTTVRYPANGMRVARSP